MVVVLPAPFGPSRQKISLRSIENESSRKTDWSSNDFETRSTSTTVVTAALQTRPCCRSELTMHARFLTLGQRK